MGIMDHLERLESQLQSLIEGSAARLFPEYNLEEELAHRLVEALKAGTKQNSEGKVIAPNLFTIEIHSGQVVRLQGQEMLLDDLTRSLQSTADEAGFLFLSPPVIRVTENREVPVSQFRVSGQISLDNLAHTTDILVDIDTESQDMPANAYLIIDGTRIYPLSCSVMNIGRRPDNQIVLDDPRVSRVHA